MIFETIAMVPTKRNAISIDVESEGMTITFKGGEFKWCGQEKQLSDDESYTVGSREDDTDIAAYLVEDTEDDNTVHVLVDEIVLDGVEEPLEFPKGGRYTVLERVLVARVPGGAEDLSAVTAQVWRHVGDVVEDRMAPSVIQEMEPSPPPESSEPTEEQIQRGFDTLKPDGGE